MENEPLHCCFSTAWLIIIHLNTVIPVSAEKILLAIETVLLNVPASAAKWRWCSSFRKNS